MNWEWAWKQLQDEMCIFLPEWDGFWVLECNEIVIYCGDGRVLNIRQTEDTYLTYSNIASNNWQSASKEQVGYQAKYDNRFA